MPLKFTAFEIIFCRLFYGNDTPVWLDLTGIHHLGKGRCSLLPFPVTWCSSSCAHQLMEVKILSVTENVPDGGT